MDITSGADMETSKLGAVKGYLQQRFPAFPVDYKWDDNRLAHSFIVARNADTLLLIITHELAEGAVDGEVLLKRILEGKVVELLLSAPQSRVVVSSKGIKTEPRER